jgi:hypothetical protein
VETAATDPVRDALIGLAPLIVGGFLAAFIGLTRLGFDQVILVFQQAGLREGLEAILAVEGQPDYWLWFYLAFTIASMMIPSEADRKSWGLIGLWVGLLLLASLLAGAGPWLLEHVAPLFDQFFTAIALLFGISSLVHLLLLLPTWGLHLVLQELTGLEVH